MTRRFVLALALVAFGFATSDALATDFLCRVQVTNNVEGAVVDTLVCQFYFIDGTQAYRERDIDIKFCDQCYNDSNTNILPTKRVTTVAKIVYGGQTVALTHDSGDAPTGECWIFVPLEINPKPLASINILKNAKTPAERLAARFTCVTVDPKTGQRVERNWVVVEDFDKYVEGLRAKGKKE
jgi:hypothetical protein